MRRRSATRSVPNAPRLHGARSVASPSLVARTERIGTALAMWIIGVVAANTGCPGLELTICLWLSGHRASLVRVLARIAAPVRARGALSCELHAGIQRDALSQVTRSGQSREGNGRGARS
jgi:hypothetical protein